MSSHLQTPVGDRRRKRSLMVPVTLFGAIAISLAACKTEPEQVEMVIFPDAETCRSGAKADESWWLGEECTSAYIEARKVHAKEAPVYESRQLCEETHEGSCERWLSPKGAEIFAPAMAGFMIGNIWQQRTESLATRPLYARKDDPQNLYTPQQERVLLQFGKTLNNAVTAFREHNGGPRQTISRASLVTKSQADRINASSGSSGSSGGFGKSRTSSAGG